MQGFSVFICHLLHWHYLDYSYYFIGYIGFCHNDSAISNRNVCFRFFLFKTKSVICAINTLHVDQESLSVLISQ